MSKKYIQTVMREHHELYKANCGKQNEASLDIRAFIYHKLWHSPSAFDNFFRFPWAEINKTKQGERFRYIESIFN